MICYRCEKQILQRKEAFSGLHKACFMEWFDLKEETEFDDVIARESNNNPGNFDDINSSFFHGKFRKYSAKLGQQSYLLKVQQEEYPELPHCEFLCNQMAQKLGLEVPAFYLIRFLGTLDTFVNRNFMQDISNASLVHIYHFLSDTDSFDCETIKNIIEEKTQRLRDVEKFIEITLFDALIGNHDRHGRNLGLIQTPSGFHLAPAYDNPSYLAIEMEKLLGAIHEPRGKIATAETEEPRLGDYLREWRRLGHVNVVDHWLNRTNQLKEFLTELIYSSFMSSKRKKAFVSLLHRRLEEANDIS